MSMAAWTVVSVLLFGITCSLGEVPGDLNLLESTDTMLKGTYVTSQGRGVYFAVGGRPDNSMTHLHIANLDGRNILRMQDLRGKHTLVSLQDKTILHVPADGRTQSKLYEVSSTHMAMAQMSVLLEGHGRLTDRLRASSQEIDDEEAISHFIDILRRRKDIEVIAEAALAVAEESGERVLTPAARSFLMTAMGLKRANLKYVSRMGRAQAQEFEGTLGPPVCQKPIMIEEHRTDMVKKMIMKAGYPGVTDCSGDGCVVSYSTKDYNNDCFGMCGPECTCWKWACGDCCVHQFCYDHDHCCSKPGFRATFRCYAPVSMAGCEEGYDCWEN